MAYSRTTWANGDLITAEKLNNLESGIIGNETEISKTNADLADLNNAISQLSGLSDDVKQALLQIAQKVAYIDDDGQDYYDALEDALYPVTPPATLSYITAVYTQSGTVYTTDSLDSLKSDLVVTAHYSDSTSAAVVWYTLSGNLTVGTSTITVTYSGKTTTFTVTVSQDASYIQTNMIMWLDGIKNGTAGSHETTLTEWIDQSGNGHNWANSSFGGSVTSDSVVFNGVGGSSGTFAYLTEDYVDVITEPQTVEIVLRFSSVPNTTQALITGLNRQNNTSWEYNGDLGIKNGKLLNMVGASKGCVAIQSGTHTYAFVNNNGTYTPYVDGTAATNGSDTISFKAPTAVIGAQLNSGNHVYGFGGEICCIRFYSSALSAEDIASNYSLDSNRFGSGT